MTKPFILFVALLGSEVVMAAQGVRFLSVISRTAIGRLQPEERTDRDHLVARGRSIGHRDLFVVRFRAWVGESVSTWVTEYCPAL